MSQSYEDIPIKCSLELGLLSVTFIRSLTDEVFSGVGYAKGAIYKKSTDEDFSGVGFVECHIHKKSYL